MSKKPTLTATQHKVLLESADLGTLVVFGGDLIAARNLRLKRLGTVLLRGSGYYVFAINAAGLRRLG
jgi:hypothetical protein